jgi:hypothetical protein
MITRILTVVLLIASVAMFAYLYNSIDSVIETKEAIRTKEFAVTERLKLIREAELVFLGAYGRYTSNWDSLANFIANGRVPIVQRREEIIQKAYGGEDVILHFDTLGYESAKEKIFRRNYVLNAGDNGIFNRFLVKVGDNVVKNQKGAVITFGGEERPQPFTEEGVITSLANVTSGAEVTKGQTLINFHRYIFDPNMDISKVGFKPDSDIKFDIFVGKVDKAGVMVWVIEVKDPMPDDPARKEENDKRPRKPLRFGSRLDVSTAGNWE